MIEEGERLGRVLGDKAVLFMCHHGTLVVADSVHVAFDEVGSRVARECDVTSAANRLIGEVVQSRRRPWLKAPASAFTFKTLC